MTQLCLELFLLGDNGAKAGSDLLLPIRDLVIAQCFETDLSEEGPVVAHGVIPDRQTCDPLGVEFERNERASSAGSEDARHLDQRVGLFRRVLQGIDAHDRIRGAGRNPSLLEAVLCELGSFTHAERHCTLCRPLDRDARQVTADKTSA